MRSYLMACVLACTMSYGYQIGQLFMSCEELDWYKINKCRAWLVHNQKLFFIYPNKSKTFFLTLFFLPNKSFDFQMQRLFDWYHVNFSLDIFLLSSDDVETEYQF